MKLSIPFLNRKNYVLLKCYNDNKYIVDAFPITRGSDNINKLPKSLTDGNTGSFKTCYGHLGAKTTTATVPMWLSFHAAYINGQPEYYLSDTQEDVVSINFGHANDPVYDHSNLCVTKIISRWYLEEDTGVNFVYAHHIKNYTKMRVPSGIKEFKYQHGLQLFNLLDKTDHSYTVTAGTPVVSLIPLTDKEFRVESHYDPDKVKELESTQMRAYFNNEILRRMRHSKDK